MFVCMNVLDRGDGEMDGEMDGWTDGDEKKGLNYCFLSIYYFSLLIYMNCISLIFSTPLSLFLIMVIC